MLQRWMITLVVSAVCCVLFSACGKKDYSPDEPLPTTYTPSVFISSQNNYLYALDPLSGVEKWEYNLKSNTIATPLVCGDYLFVANVDSIVILDVNSGKRVIGFNNNPDYQGIVSSPVTDGKLIIFASNPGPNASKVIAINTANINTQNSPIAWTKDYPTTNITPSLALYQDQLIVAQDNGTVDCISKNNGTNIWVTSATIPLASGRNLYSSPAISYPYVYIGSTDKNLYALSLTTGAQAWTFAADNEINSSPIVYGGNVIFGCNDNYIYCVDSIAKDIRWKYKTFDRVISSASANRNVVFMGGYDNYVYAINVLDGNLKWSFKTNALVKASVLSVGGNIYAASFDKILYKLDTAGNLKWQHNINGAIESSPILYDNNDKRTYYPSISDMYR